MLKLTYQEELPAPDPSEEELSLSESAKNGR